MIGWKKLATVALLLGAAGCGHKEPPKVPGSNGPNGPNGPPVGAKTQGLYDAAIQAFIGHDKASDWSDATCDSMAKQFIAVNSSNKDEAHAELSPAIYDAGLAYQRCNNDGEARKLFAQALQIDPKAHRAKVQLALYEYKDKGDAGLEPAITALQQAVLDAEFQNPDALVNLAMLQMKRNSGAAGQGCANDFDCAKKNIQRALAVDDAFMPAFNQLAILQLEVARSKAGKRSSRAVVSGRRDKRVDQQQLELAALVCSQAVRKNPKYAPIHNTFGLIQVESGNINNAVQEFKTAAQIDPGFFEAQMNYAAVNLSFRGFKNAEDAYRGALKIKPNDYDANLGLALAVRGQISDQNYDANVKESQGLLDKAKQLAPDRPEAYYNEGILTQEYKVKAMTDDKAKIPVYEQAKSIFQTFIQKAGGGAEYADAVKRANERISDINDTEKFISEGLKNPPPREGGAPASDQPEGLEGPSGGDAGGAKPPPQLSK